ncbi:hypothetical protein K4749_00305 [Streptomyces sp. TRM72054]|uniref:hypothetical protein n=1 Tax=Streptomyces sp. TRM72054 TaxID=2870562 RepID=UPI001C8BA0BD|nr:hypothetical protein [Streptomyces sp. TRM72054]MBX9392077.1 hypothetical protein [Streptomyces sp. TRM72054]
MTDLNGAVLPPGIRRLIVAVDLAGYSRHDHLRQLNAQRRLMEVMQRVCQETGIDRDSCLRQPQGDGELLLLPPALDEGRVVPGLVQELSTAVREINRDLHDEARLRLRAALHQGIVHEGANGFVSRGVVRACRLLDSPLLREALNTLPACELALAVSDQLFEDVLEHGYRGLDPARFSRYRVEIPDKGFAADTWLYLSFDPQRLAAATNAPMPPIPPPWEVAPNLYQNHPPG